MMMSEIKCRKCGQDASQASKRGAYLNRVSPKGGPFVGECRPSCEHLHGGPNEAVLNALDGVESLGETSNSQEK